MWGEPPDEMPDDVREEILDPKFDTRTHGIRATYAAGCRGALCKKAERDSGHEKYAKRRARAGGRPARVGLRDDDVRMRDELLDRMQFWHIRDREYLRLSKLGARRDLVP